MKENIVVKGARTHNLKNITVEIPRNTMTVFTGLSGSGKSSLAFDTIFAEGQRRYVESLSSYARQFLNQMQKPDVDEIVGLSPAISIDQTSRSNNPRSTVATITEIYDYLRVLYARIGHPHCLVCGRPITRLTTEEIQNIILEKVDGHTEDGVVSLYAPVVRGRKGEYYQLLYDLLNRGYSRVIVDGEKKNLREQILLDKNKKHDIDVVVDEIVLSEFENDRKSAKERLSEAVERSLEEAGGLVRVVFPGETSKEKKRNEMGTLFSSKFSCPHDGYSYPEVEPRLFSFNSPYGACSECRGLGTREWRGKKACPVCGGARLREEALHVYLDNGENKLNIADFTRLSIEDAYTFIENLVLNEKETEISGVITREIEDRLKFMLDVGIEYLTLNRRANTLSGGEAQRIRLASQLGSKLVGALYVLDEPTIGLHPRDNDRLVGTLKDLRDMGNTIIVVEHDENTIFASDYMVDLGPRAGVHGGEVVVADYIKPLLEHDSVKNNSLTLKYLKGEKNVPVPEKRRTANKGSLKIRGGKKFNIKNLNIDIPLGKFIAVSGISGSGKSTLLYHLLHKNLRARFDRRYRSNDVYNCKRFEGTEYVARSILIDQSPIGRTSRSNPATYTKAFDYIRDLFAETKDAKVRGWGKGRFTFNTKGGRCEACKGKGDVAVEMHFLPTVHVPCDICDGKRFTKETLEVEYKGKNIYEVLTMTVEEALKFFGDIPAIADRMQTLYDVGLGYLELGQPATTLSGGEAQRIKIASELYRRHTQKTVYLLDEPTVGLHYEDVRNLIEILQRLVDEGNTVVVIEHNMDIIKSADHIVDMGPEGGEKGGEIIAQGTPEDVASQESSFTGTYLKKTLRGKK